MAHTTVGGTRLLYQEQGDLHEHEATISSIEEIPGKTAEAAENQEETHSVFLDETIFHVRGGGQPFDLGQLSLVSETSGIFEVKSVQNGDQSRIPHSGRFVSSSAVPFKSGDRIKMAIDVDRRTLNSRLHSAGHILGAATMQLSREGLLPTLIETKASHAPGTASVEFQGLIEGKFKDQIQARANDLVEQALPITIHFWDRAECESNGITQLPEKVAAGDEQKAFRTIVIGDCHAYPCGGTHVRDTSGVGKITVKRISRQKGTTKVSYEVD